MALNAVKKITLKEIIKGKPAKEEVDVGDGKKEMRVKDQDIALFFGQVMTFESGSTQFGSYRSFVGRFEARRIKDGEIFQSTRAILPGIAEEMTFVSLAEAQREDPNAVLNVAYVLGVEYDERGTEGYKWTVKPVSTGEQQVDPLAALRNALASNSETAGLIGAQKAPAVEDKSKSKTTEKA